MTTPDASGSARTSVSGTELVSTGVALDQLPHALRNDHGERSATSTPGERRMNIGEICNRTVVFTYRTMALDEAARLMREHHVGSLVVVEDSAHGRKPIGIITDRDIVVAVVARDVAPSSVTVGDVMSAELATARDEDSIVEALHTMRRKGVRRLPVVKRDGVLVGIVTVDDLLDIVAEQLREIVRAVESETGREARQRGG
jgi:CBS domain-containing protein